MDQLLHHELPGETIRQYPHSPGICPGHRQSSDCHRCLEGNGIAHKSYCAAGYARFLPQPDQPRWYTEFKRELSTSQSIAANGIEGRESCSTAANQADVCNVG